MSQSKNPLTVPVKEAARLLSVSEGHMRKLLMDRAIKATKAGDRVLVHRMDLKNYLDATVYTFLQLALAIMRGPVSRPPVRQTGNLLRSQE